jgi:hypothetical protein
VSPIFLEALEALTRNVDSICLAVPVPLFPSLNVQSAIFHTTRPGSNEKHFTKLVYRAIQ